MLLENIQDICKKKHISISQLERDLDFARGYVFKWKEIDPGITKVQKVATYLNVKVDNLLN